MLSLSLGKILDIWIVDRCLGHIDPDCPSVYKKLWSHGPRMFKAMLEECRPFPARYLHLLHLMHLSALYLDVLGSEVDPAWNTFRGVSKTRAHFDASPALKRPNFPVKSKEGAWTPVTCSHAYRPGISSKGSSSRADRRYSMPSSTVLRSLEYTSVSQLWG